jgi:arsenate reductase
VTPSSKTRVLFICIGNSCRSQMAEGFARTYGADVMIAASAGLAPAFMVAQDTVRAMDEKNIDLRDQFPKSLKQLGRAQFDLFVNMSGYDLPPEIDTPCATGPSPIRSPKITKPTVRSATRSRPA